MNINKYKIVLVVLIFLLFVSATTLATSMIKAGGEGGAIPIPHFETPPSFTKEVSSTGAVNFSQTATYYGATLPGFPGGHTIFLTANFTFLLKQGNRILFDGDSVCPGDKIDFVFSNNGGFSDGEWFWGGGNNDSPPAYWKDGPITKETFDSLPDHGCEPQNFISAYYGGAHYFPLIIQNPSASLIGNHIDCSNDSCVISSGSLKNVSPSITATLSKAYIYPALANMEDGQCKYLSYAWGTIPTISGSSLVGTGALQPVTKTWNLKLSPFCKFPAPIPVITSPSSAPPDWCETPFQYLLNWEVNTTQKAKQVQVSSSNDFTSIVYDSGKVSIAGDVTAYTLPATGSGLEYNKTYYWRVRVWNADDVASVGWSAVQSFTTPKHQYPDASFKVTKSEDNNIKFTDASKAYGGSTISKRSWTFQDGDPASSTEQNPSVVFNTSENKIISLSVTDTDGYSCSISKNSGKPGKFIWTEVAP